MKKRQLKTKRQSGASTLEAMIALMLMCLLFFGAMNIFLWVLTRMFCDYSSFYTAKAFSLGYAWQTIRKATNIAAIPISGKDEDKILSEDRENLISRLQLYMSTGNAGVNFAFWDNGGRRGKEPTLYFQVPSVKKGEPKEMKGTVELRNTTYLDGIRKVMLIGRPGTTEYKDVEGSTQTINHSAIWMESSSSNEE